MDNLIPTAEARLIRTLVFDAAYSPKAALSFETGEVKAGMESTQTIKTAQKMSFNKKYLIFGVIGLIGLYFFIKKGK